MGVIRLNHKFFDKLKTANKLIRYALNRIDFKKYDFINLMRIDIFLKKNLLIFLILIGIKLCFHQCVLFHMIK